MLCFRLLVPAACALLFLLVWGPLAAMASEELTRRARTFLEEHTRKLRPLEVASAIAWWDANTTGDKAAYEKKTKAQNAIDEALADSAGFARLKELHEKRTDIDDPTLRRAIDILHLQYLEKQVDKDLLRRMVELANAVEEKFNVFRARVDGKAMNDNEVRKVLKDSTDSARRRTVWEASKEVGAVVEADLKALVKLRNEAARKLGFKNFQDMTLRLNEQNPEEILKLFDELDQLTAEPFRAVKAEIDARLAAKCSIAPSALMPWHYHDPFFQESPAVYPANLDQPFQKADLLAVSRTYYADIGLPIDRVIARSSLYPKDGKSPHAFCTDIDREGDVRVLANIDATAYWMSTLLHEFGHAVYSTNTDNVPAKLPYVLRSEAHILATEGVAMLFERETKRRSWVEKMGLALTDADAWQDAGTRSLRAQLLIFSRWCQVMLRFEKGMYENPDQDLSELWWSLVEKYQNLRRPEGRKAPDYGSKIHIVAAPVYYHNYMMGELFASQVHHTLAREVFKGADPNTITYVGNKDVGAFMRQRVFAPGRTLSWNDLTKHATGEPLNARAFAADFRTKK